MSTTTADLHAPLAAALRKTIDEVSDAPFADCHLVALVARDVLRRMGINARIVAGYAAWRLDPADPAAVLMDHPDAIAVENKSKAHQSSFHGHVWLEVDDHIVDFTTYRFRQKIQWTDEIMGRKTQITWMPDYLWMPKRETLTRLEVINGFKVGAWYQKDLSLLRYLNQHPPQYTPRIIDLVLEIYHMECTEEAIGLGEGAE